MAMIWKMNLASLLEKVIHGLFGGQMAGKNYSSCYGTPKFQITAYACLFFLIFFAGLHTLYFDLLT